MLGIVTDSASDLEPEDVERLGIEVVPLSIRFGDREFIDGVELTIDQFYAELAASDDLPETSAPAPGAFVEAFDRLKARGATEIVTINLSSALSATMQSAVTAAEMVDDIDIRVVDSKSITAGLGTMVINAATAADDGADADAIVAMIESQRERTHVFGALDTLDNLKKGGRIGGAQALIGTMLSIKPLLDLSSGAVEEAGRQRTRKKSMGWLRDKVVEAKGAENLSVMHGNAPDIDDFLTLIESEVDISSVRIGKIGPVIGTHGGPRVLGIAYLLPE
ncbi:MAG: DegV family protein [Acidimicrobiales bacterium]